MVPAPDATASSASTALKLWVVLARAYQAIERHAAAHAAEHGLTSAEFGVLEALYHKGPLLLGEVQRKLLISSAGITYVVDRLERKGLVERRPCPTDRRARYAALTQDGSALIERIFPEHQQRMELALAGLDAPDQERATDLLRTLGRQAAQLATSSGA